MGGLCHFPRLRELDCKLHKEGVDSMRKYFLFAVILIASALTATAADVTGKWDGTLTPVNRDQGSALLILKQTGDVVTGLAERTIVTSMKSRTAR